MNNKRLKREAFFKYIIVPVLLMIGGFAFPAYSQNQERGGLHQLTLSHGLSDLLVNTIFKDQEGYVWFGTESSIDRFDGNRIFRIPIPGDKHKSRRVLCLAEDEGFIYVGTNQGLFSIAKGSTILTSIYPDKIDMNVNSLSIGNGNLYIGTGKGLYIYNIKNGSLTRKLLVEDNFSDVNNIKGMWLKDDKVLWLLTPHRLWRIPLPDFAAVAYPLPVNAVSTRLCSLHDMVYAGTDGDGIVPFDIKTLQFKTPIKVGNNIVTSLSATPSGELMIGTDGEGIYVYSVKRGEVTDHLTTSPDSGMQLRSNSVYSTLKDDNGLLWVGYYQSGVDYTPQLEFEPERVTLPVDLGMTQHVVRSFDRKAPYSLIGTHEGLIFINESTGKIQKYTSPEIASNLIMTVKYWKGEFYIGLYHGGIYRLNPVTGVISRYGPRSMDTESIFNLEVDPSDNLWAATSEGLYQFEDEIGRPSIILNSKNSQLPAGNVYNIFFDSMGRGWICTENGLAIWKGQYIETSGFPKGFIDKMKIRQIYEDSNNRLYFAPDRGDLWVSDLALQDFHPLVEEGHERFGQTVSIIEDRDGWIWVGTDKGLVRFDKNDRNNFVLFNHAGGVMNPVYTLAKPYMNENGDLWFGSTTGIHKVDFTKFKKEYKQETTPLYISEIESGGKSMIHLLEGGEGRWEVKLGDDQGDVTIWVSDMSFKPLEFFELEYKLDGEDKDWNWKNGESSISYHNLKTGTHTLRIREAGNPNSEVVVKIRKSSPFPWWWIAGGAVIVIITVLLTLYLKHQKEHKLLAAQTGQAEKAQEEEKNVTPIPEPEEKVAYKTTRLSDEECKRLLKKLDNVMKTEKPFKNPNLKIKDLAAMIDSNAHSLSFLFNQYLDKSYYDYVNEWRVGEFKRLVKEIDPSKYTLTSMAEMCGFSSRASFFRHFKTHTGMTPAEYLKESGKVGK